MPHPANMYNYPYVREMILQPPLPLVLALALLGVSGAITNVLQSEMSGRTANVWLLNDLSCTFPCIEDCPLYLSLAITVYSRFPRDGPSIFNPLDTSFPGCELPVALQVIQCI
jgi:hypothetical protein